jgi:structural maintenance of chromosome 4
VGPQQQRRKAAAAELQAAEARAARAEKAAESAQAALREHRRKFEESKSAMAEGRSAGAVRALKENRGSLKGMVGRLGDLGAIDAKYDAAITTACGQLDNVVVETVEAATRCIDFLKCASGTVVSRISADCAVCCRRHQLGRATFMVMEKINAARMNEPCPTPEGAPRLFDLVKPKTEALRTAFYFALRDTVVADNLDQATRSALLLVRSLVTRI